MSRVVVVVVVAVACLAAAVFVIDRVTTNDGDSVLILGDSITEWGEPALNRDLGGRFDLEVVGHGGYRSDQLEPDAVAAAATNPVQVVLNVGTNDALQHRPPSEVTASIERMVALFPKAECVHVVTVNPRMRDKDGTDQAGAEEIDDAIHELPSRYPNVSVIDWADIVDRDAEAHPPMGTLTPDTIHPGPHGERVLIHTYDDALQRCGRPWRIW